MHDIVQIRSVINSAEITLECSYCHGVNQTDVLTIKTIDKIFGLLSVWSSQETVVQCPDCNTTFATPVSIERLQQMSPVEIAKVFQIRIRFVAKALVFLASVLFCFFPISPVLFLIARFMVPKNATGWRLATTLGLIASILLPVLLIGVAMVLDLLSAK